LLKEIEEKARESRYKYERQKHIIKALHNSRKSSVISGSMIADRSYEYFDNEAEDTKNRKTSEAYAIQDKYMLTSPVIGKNKEISE